MTTVVYRNGVMAADTQITHPQGIRTRASLPKVAKDGNGVLYGVSGDYAPCCKVIAAINHQRETGGSVVLPIPKDGDRFEILIAYPDGRLRCLAPAGEEVHDDDPYMAIGLGAPVAFGALFAGANAERAVMAAISHGEGTGGALNRVEFDPDYSNLGRPDQAEVEDVALTPAMVAMEQAMKEALNESINASEIDAQDAEAAFDQIAREG